MWSDLKEFNIDSFHFLRPDLLWLFLPLILVVAILFVTTREKDKWKSIVSRPLRRFMFTRSSKLTLLWPLIFLVLTISFGILSAAGPTWKRVEVPGMKSTAMFVILMDLSWSMMAEDIQPNRLERAKLKVRDLLDANPGARTSLFVYAGTTHPVMPASGDYKLIKYHADHLQANIMPVRGDDLPLAMDLMDTLFARFEVPSTLLLVTDEVETSETSDLMRFVDTSPHSIEILVMSTPGGSEIPGFRRNTILRDDTGQKIISRADPNVWNQLDQHPSKNLFRNRP